MGKKSKSKGGASKGAAVKGNEGSNTPEKAHDQPDGEEELEEAGHEEGEELATLEPEHDMSPQSGPTGEPPHSTGLPTANHRSPSGNSTQESDASPFAFSAPEKEADETVTEADEQDASPVPSPQFQPRLEATSQPVTNGLLSPQIPQNPQRPSHLTAAHHLQPSSPVPDTPGPSDWGASPTPSSPQRTFASQQVGDGEPTIRNVSAEHGRMEEGSLTRSRSRSRSPSPKRPASRSSSPPAQQSPPTQSHPNHSTHHSDPSEQSAQIDLLTDELERTRGERDQLNTQYRGLLGKLTQMRSSLGDKLREDAEELDRRETQINQLHADLSESTSAVDTLRQELSNSSTECAHLSSQLSQLRASSSSSSSDVLSLTRELRELRGELEMVRVEREEWEAEAGRERERRERLEEETRFQERLFREEEGRRRAAEDGWEMEKQRARNLQDVLGEFQAAKDLEIEQATSELESQLRQVVQSLSDFKLRAAEAESRLGNYKNDASKSSQLDRELKEKNATIGRLRHEAVVTQEHLTEALRRLRRNSSDTNVDRRLVTNILLQFLGTPRADPKRFEMLSLLSTILSWEDGEREKAGLQRSGGSAGPSRTVKRKGSTMNVKGGEREKTQAEMDTFNESFSNLFVEFLLKEAAQGQANPAAGRTERINSSHGAYSPPGSTIATSPPPGSAYGGSSKPTGRGRTYSNGSMSSVAPSMFGSALGSSQPSVRSPTGPPGDRLNTFGRKVSFGPTGAHNQSLAMVSALGQAGSIQRTPSPSAVAGGGVPLPRDGQGQEGYSNTRML